MGMGTPNHALPYSRRETVDQRFKKMTSPGHLEGQVSIPESKIYKLGKKIISGR